MDIDAFLNTLRDDVLDVSEYSDEQRVSSRLASLDVAIIKFCKVSNDSELQEFFDNVPNATDFAALLLGTPNRHLRDAIQRKVYFEYLLRWKAWTQDAELRDVVVGLLLADAHRSRTQRRRRAFVHMVRDRLNAAVEISPQDLSLRSFHRLGSVEYSRNFDHVVFDATGPVMAVVAIFQTTSGGRQESIFAELPNLQTSLAREGVSLLVIADGPGFMQMENVVRRVAPTLAHLTNLYGAEQGQITFALNQATSERDKLRDLLPNDLDAGYTEFALAALRSGRSVTPDLLGLSTERASDFILRFQVAHPEYALARNRDDELLPADIEKITAFNESVRRLGEGHPEAAQDVIASLAATLSYRTTEYRAPDGLRLYGIETPGVQLRLPSPLPVFIRTADDTITSQFIIECIDALLSHGDLVSRLAVLVDTFDSANSRKVAAELSHQQRSQIVIMDETDLQDLMLRHQDAARKYLSKLIVMSADLSLISPFVSDGPTSPDMFFGRDTEIRRVMEQINYQSFALVGGRKIGKTSMLRQLERLLPARVPVCYIDCQARSDRETFLRSLVESIVSESPLDDGGDLIANTEHILRSFLKAKFNDSFGVLLLDEVDELFLADSEAVEHRHIFSRSLRSVSQSSTASIVVTGERALFKLTRDPGSPHWNFCTPIRIGPLSQDAARRLLREPLGELGVEISTDGVTEALLLTASHPNLLQNLGNQVIDLLSPLSRSGGQLRVKRQTVESIARAPAFRNRFRSTFWSQSSVLERLISVLLERQLPKTGELIQTELVREGINVSVSDVLEALTYLELYSIAQEFDGGYILGAEAFGIHFQELAHSALVGEWKDKLR